MNRLTPLISAVGLAATLAGGCDSTVGLDPTRPSFTDIVAPGVCPVDADLGQVDISVMILATGTGILPDDVLLGESQSVGELISPTDFTFRQDATGGATFPNNQAWVNSVNAQTDTGVDLQAINFQFDWNGGEDRREDEKLIVIMMDHSGSIIGRNPENPNDPPERTRASDFAGDRFQFFRTFVGDLDENDWVSLVHFNGTFNSIGSLPELATPSLNREQILTGLDNLSRVPNLIEDGQTPLADALDDVLTRIIDIDQNADLNPMVVLFTDGVELGDPSSVTLSDVKARYAAKNVPIIVLDLQSRLPGGQGEDASLASLACETGGEYLFLRDPLSFTADPDLPDVVLNRVQGVWRLRAETSMAGLPSDTYRLSTELTLTLGTGSEAKSASVPLSLSRDDATSTILRDNRLRLFK